MMAENARDGREKLSVEWICINARYTEVQISNFRILSPRLSLQGNVQYTTCTYYAQIMDIDYYKILFFEIIKNYRPMLAKQEIL